MSGSDPFELEGELPPGVEEALAWQASRTPFEIVQERETIMSNLEAAGQAMWGKGLCAEWLRGGDANAAKVSATVNGVMMADLCRAVDFHDFECVEMFRAGESLFVCVRCRSIVIACVCLTGGSLYGLLEQCGLGAFMPGEPDGSIRDVRATSDRSNAYLLSKLRTDAFEDELHRLTCADAELGRMSWPEEARCVDLSSVRLCPR